MLGPGYVSVQQVQMDTATVRNDQAMLKEDRDTIAYDQATVQANGPTLQAPGLQSTMLQETVAEEQMALANANQIRADIVKARIVSPINGVVVNRNLNPGEYPGSRQIFTLQQIDPMYMYLRGSSTQIAGVRRGETATVKAVVSGGHTISENGTVTGVLDEIVPGTTQFQVVVQVANPQHIWRSGMPVQGTVNLEPASGIQIPETAFTDENRDAIQIVQSNDTVKTVNVKEIATNGTVAIISGIPSGTRVVSNGESTNLGEGEKVSYQQ